jgi:integrase
MTNTSSMYASNCKEYAQYALENKQLASSTRKEWTMLINRLPLDQFPYPPKEIDLWNMVNTRYPNPRTKRSTIATLNILLGTTMKVGRESHPIFDLPDFEEVDAYIQTPKNKYQKRVQMYANLMLHAGLRIGETMYKHKVIKNSIHVEFQRVAHDNSIQKSKTVGQVLLPDWLMDEYRDWEVDCSSHRCLKDWFYIYFHSKEGIPFPNLSPHKLRHMYATYYATKVPPSTLMKQLRHSSVTTTMAYYVHIDENHLMNVLNEGRKHLRVVND